MLNEEKTMSVDENLFLRRACGISAASDSLKQEG